jgi:chromosomal replication initiator protein
MYLAREILGCSLTEIAQNFQKDHSTVLHSVRKITADLQKDATLVRKINSVKKEMGL